MITVHHLNNSRSQRILWMLEELTLDYEIKHYQRDAKTMLAPDELIKIHPLGKSPVITDGKNTIAESGNIIDYLGREYPEGKLRPDELSDAFLQYQYWLHFAEGSMMFPLLLMLVMQKIEENSPILFVKPIAKEISRQVNKKFIKPNMVRQLAFVDTHLKINQWFAGKTFSGADIQMSFPLEAAVHRGLCDNFPAIIEYVETIQARPAYKTALEKGGEYLFSSSS